MSYYQAFPESRMPCLSPLLYTISLLFFKFLSYHNFLLNFTRLYFHIFLPVRGLSE